MRQITKAKFASQAKLTLSKADIQPNVKTKKPDIGKEYVESAVCVRDAT